MEDLKFDLQLFAEGTPSVEGMEQPVVDSVDTGSPEPQTDFDWSVDPDTNEVTFDPSFFDDMESDGEEGESAPPYEPEEQPQHQAPALYTVKINGVEQQVTLEELQKGYMLNSDYTKKTQALAEQRKQLESQYSQPQNPQPQPEQQPQPQPELDPKLYYQNLSDYAIKQVSKVLGEDFDETNPIHQAALADQVATIKAVTYERDTAQRGLKSVYDKYSQDPNYTEIDRYAAQRLQNLPYAQAVQIQKALQNYDSRTVDAFMGACRDEFYRSKGYVTVSELQNPTPVQTRPAQPVPRVRPPFVESTGAAQNKEAQPPRLDLSKIGGLPLEDQAKLASKYGLM